MVLRKQLSMIVTEAWVYVTNYPWLPLKPTFFVGMSKLLGYILPPQQVEQYLSNCSYSKLF